nr:histidine kinase [Fulvivirga lutimaris]
MENKKKTLENEKLAVELKYLKSQINPHFLFNTLHNLNYLTQIKSDQASEVIVMLSNIMRYMIYDSNKPSVTLRKEIDYIQDYLALEAIRLNNKFDLKFDVTEANDQLEIAPLIFIPFVENAFKHGISDKDEKSWIDIRLSTKENIMYLVVENSIGEKVDMESSGVGLENVKKRLALGYPGKYTLDIDESEKKYHVSLTLDLA